MHIYKRPVFKNSSDDAKIIEVITNERVNVQAKIVYSSAIFKLTITVITTLTSIINLAQKIPFTNNNSQPYNTNNSSHINPHNKTIILNKVDHRDSEVILAISKER